MEKTKTSILQDRQNQAITQYQMFQIPLMEGHQPQG